MRVALPSASNSYFDSGGPSLSAQLEMTSSREFEDRRSWSGKCRPSDYGVFRIGTISV